MFKKRLQVKSPNKKVDEEFGECVYTLYGNPLYTVVILCICIVFLCPLYEQLRRPFLDYRPLYWIGVIACICVMIASFVYINKTNIYEYGMTTTNLFHKRGNVLAFDEIESIRFTKRRVASIRYSYSFYQWNIHGKHHEKEIHYSFEPSDFLLKRKASMQTIALIVDELQIPIEHTTDKSKVKKI